MARRAEYIDSLRAQYGDVLLLDAGEFTAPPSATSEAKGLYVLEIMKKIGYDAVNPATTELKLGLDVLLPVARDCPVPFVSANLRDAKTGALLFRESVVVKKGGMRVGITGVLEPAHAHRPAIDSLGVAVEDASAALARVLPGLRASSDLVVLLAHLPESDARKLGERFFGQIDLVVVGMATQSRGIVTTEHGGALYLTAGNRGQAVGFVKVAKGDGRPKALVGEEVVLTRDYPEDEEIAQAAEAFRRHLNEVTKVSAVSSAAGGRRSADGEYFVGVSNCASCHAKEFEIWSETPHAHAFATLVDRGADALPECARCHVTGAADPVGYNPGIEAARSLVNVQCEVCHDKGTLHARDGSYGRNLGMNACVSCHDPENSPDFDPEVYWRMIEH